MRRAALLVLLAGCAEPMNLERFLPARSRWILEAPDRVTAYRIDSAKLDRSKDISRTYDRYPVTAETAVEGDARAELLRLFADPGSFSFEGKGCIPDPGVKLRFVRGAAVEDYYLCFHCAMIARQGATGEVERFADFDTSAPAFVKLVQRLFPKDSDFKNLK